MTTLSLRVLCSAALAAGLVFGAPALAQQKTAKQCNEEWKANEAALQASGKTKKEFVAECRGTAPATSGATVPGATQAPAAAPKTATKPPATGKTGAPAAAGQFSTEAQAKAHCPSDNVVWVNLSSKVYHFSGSKSYGNTKKGAYMCERDTAAAGFRAAKNEKHP